MNTPNHIVYGANDVHLDVAGRTVAQIEAAVADILNLPTNVEVYVDGRHVSDETGTFVEIGQRIEVMKERGDKGSDLWSDREFRRRYGATERDFRQCIERGMNAEQLRSGAFAIDDDEAVRWGRQLVESRTTNHATPNKANALYDDDTCTVHWQGHTCHLGNTKPFRLFKVLADRHGQYVSINELSTTVWNPDVPEKNTVQAHFTRLRRNLKEAGITGLIIDGTSLRNHYRLIQDV